MTVIQCTNVTKKYRKSKALNKLSFSIDENKITGMIGRNGAGKTTILKILAGFIRETSGDVNVFSENPFNSLTVSANSILVDDTMQFPTSLSLKELLIEAEKFYHQWDARLANRLFDYFSFDSNQRHDQLSKGMKSTFNMIVGLASRCPLTIFDEPTTGMDEAVRKDFYRALLKDYIAHPRTILLSSHHLNEVEGLLEDVLLLKEGQTHTHTTIAKLKEYAIGFKGKSAIITSWVNDQTVLYQKNLGPDQTYVVLRNDFTSDRLEQARLNGLEISSVSPSDVCVYLTSNSQGGIDDVFNENKTI